MACVRPPPSHRLDRTARLRARSPLTCRGTLQTARTACHRRPEAGPRRSHITTAVSHYVIRIARSATIAALFVFAALAGILSGVLFAYAGDLPRVTALDD